MAPAASTACSVQCQLRPTPLLARRPQWKPAGLKCRKQLAEFQPVKQRDAVFDFDAWERHRTIDRHWRHLGAFPSSPVFWNTMTPVLNITLLASLVPLYDQFLGGVPNIPLLPFSMWSVIYERILQVSTGLGLLLVFRTNASYDRYWEARKLWGGLLNRTRDVVRQGSDWFKDDSLKDALMRYTIAFPRSLKVHLRGDEDIEKELQHLLKPHELKQLKQSQNRPMHVLQMMTEIVKQAQFKDKSKVLLMDQNITFFNDVLGGCERILRCPIPLSYTRHTSRFMIGWLCLLPLVFYKQFGFGMVPAIFLMSYGMIGIETIGNRIEEPFSLLNLEGICNTCETNLKEMLSMVSTVNQLVEKNRPYSYGVPTRKDGVVHALVSKNKSSDGVAVQQPEKTLASRIKQLLEPALQKFACRLQ
eukprot:jgi/Chlat1/7133/Chrsp57S06806